MCSLDGGLGVWSTPVCSPSRKPACSSDGFHRKQHCMDLCYGAPTPDHTRGTAGEPPSVIQPYPGRRRSSQRPFLGEACGFCKGFPACMGPIRIKDQAGIIPSLGVLWILMKTQQRAQKGAAAGTCFHEAMGLVGIRFAIWFLPGTRHRPVFPSGGVAGSLGRVSKRGSLPPFRQILRSNQILFPPNPVTFRCWMEAALMHT